MLNTYLFLHYFFFYFFICIHLSIFLLHIYIYIYLYLCTFEWWKTRQNTLPLLDPGSSSLSLLKLHHFPQRCLSGLNHFSTWPKRASVCCHKCLPSLRGRILPAGMWAKLVYKPHFTILTRCYKHHKPVIGVINQLSYPLETPLCTSRIF